MAVGVHIRYQPGSKCDSKGHTISPDRRNPKKHRHKAAHSILASLPFGSSLHVSCSFTRISGVIGRRHLEDVGVAFSPTGVRSDRPSPGLSGHNVWSPGSS